jgi:2-hydroxycyclohexanecarboxyl-CoA dehydrogenase
MGNSTNRIAMVTGAGQGVGRQVALDLLTQGVATTIVVNDYVAERTEAVAEEIREAGGQAIAAPADVNDMNALKAIVADTAQSHGPISILVNNAGNSGNAGLTKDASRFWETEPEDWSTWIDVNFFGVMKVTRAVLPGMVELGYGRIVTVVSDAGRIGEPQLVAYSGAKAGAAGFTRAIAKSVGRFGITANCVSLSATQTPTMAGLATLTDEDRKKFLSNYAVKRFGEPQDASAAIVFLASESAGWITTQTLPVNGGYSAAL